MMKVHPSEVLREYRETYSGTQKELAEAMSVTPKTVSLLLNSKARITLRIARALEAVFKRPAHFWLNLQNNYDLGATGVLSDETKDRSSDLLGLG